MVARYGKEVIISEAGSDVSAEAAAKSFLADRIEKAKSVSRGKGLGVFYWEPLAGLIDDLIEGHGHGGNEGASGADGQARGHRSAVVRMAARGFFEELLVRRGSVS